MNAASTLPQSGFGRLHTIPRKRDGQPDPTPWFLQDGFLPIPNALATYWFAELDPLDFRLIFALYVDMLSDLSRRLSAEEVVTTAKTLAELQQLTNFAKAAILRATGRLESCGLLAVERRSRHPNKYSLVLTVLCTAPDELEFQKETRTDELEFQKETRTDELEFQKETRTDELEFQKETRTEGEDKGRNKSSSSKPVHPPRDAVTDADWAPLLELHQRWQTHHPGWQQQLTLADVREIKRLVSSTADFAASFGNDQFRTLDSLSRYLRKEAKAYAAGDRNGPPAHLRQQALAPKDPETLRNQDFY